MEQIINKFEAYLLTEKRVSQSTFEAYMRDIRQLVGGDFRDFSRLRKEIEFTKK